MNTWNDERLERIISIVLRTGVILSAVIVLSGGIGYMVRHGHELADYPVFHGTPPEYWRMGDYSRHGVFELSRDHSIRTSAANRNADRASDVFTGGFCDGAGLDLRRDYGDCAGDSDFCVGMSANAARESACATSLRPDGFGDG
jgi:hypothetical protein